MVVVNVALSDVDVNNLIAIINGAQIKGDMAETIVLLKQKLVNAFPKVAPAIKTPANPVAPIKEVPTAPAAPAKPGKPGK